MLVLLPRLRYLQAQGLVVVSYADDLTLLGPLADIRRHFPILSAYLRHLGLKVNPDKSLWYLCSANPALQEELAALIADLKWGEVTTSLIKLLGAALRVGTGTPVRDWETLPGERELRLRRRLLRLHAIPAEGIREGLVRGFVASTSYAAAFEPFLAPVSQQTNRWAMNAVLRFHNVRYCEEVLGCILARTPPPPDLGSLLPAQ